MCNYSFVNKHSSFPSLDIGMRNTITRSLFEQLIMESPPLSMESLTIHTGRRCTRISFVPIFGTYPQYTSTQTSIPTTTATRHMYPGRATTLTQTPVISSPMILISLPEVLLREVADPDLRVGSLDREIRGSVMGSESFLRNRHLTFSVAFSSLLFCYRLWSNSSLRMVYDGLK